MTEPTPGPSGTPEVQVAQEPQAAADASDAPTALVEPEPAVTDAQPVVPSSAPDVVAVEDAPTPPEEPTDLSLSPPAESAPGGATEIPRETDLGRPPVEHPPLEHPAVEPSADRVPVEQPGVQPGVEPLVEPALSEPAAVQPASDDVQDAPAPFEAADEDAVPAGSDQPSGALVSVLAGMAVALALLAGLLSYEFLHTRGPAPVEASRRAALEAGRDAARLVFSYDYRHLSKDFQAGRAVTTGTFRSEYDRTTSRLVKDVAPRYHAVVLADVSEASVVSVTESRVILLIFVNQQSSSTLTANPKITQSRLEITMQRLHGRWLVANIKAL